MAKRAALLSLVAHQGVEQTPGLGLAIAACREWAAIVCAINVQRSSS